MTGKWQAGYGDSFESYKYKKLGEDDYKYPIYNGIINGFIRVRFQNWLRAYNLS